MIATAHKNSGEGEKQTATVGRMIRADMVNRLKDGMEKHSSVFVVSYTKLSSGKMDDFRKTLKRAKAKIYVSRNTIARKALKDLSLDKLNDKVSGQMAFIFSDADSAEISKTLTKFVKECEGILVKGGLIQGEILEGKDIARLAALPSKEVLLLTLLQTLQAPLFNLAFILNSKTHDLVSLLKQLSERKTDKQ